jgi:predicted regulator of Ras-like GTPase activity (Roadblock/LC7/MglB family)
MPLTGTLPALTRAEANLKEQSDTLLRMITGHWVAQTVRAAADLRVTDHVAAVVFSANTEASRIFSQAMADLSGQVADDVVELLDLDGASSVADIGGANGSLVVALLRAHPDLAVVASTQAEVGLVACEMALLARRVSGHLPAPSYSQLRRAGANLLP